MVMLEGSMLQYTQYVIYFTAGFMLLPTGRDVIAPGKAILPGDEKLMPAMTAKPGAGDFVWRVFGTNFIIISILKFMCLGMGVAAMNFFIVFALQTSALTFYLVTHKASMETTGSDITPFLALFGLETIAWLVTILV
jgi:hypothetical protein